MKKKLADLVMSDMFQAKKKNTFIGGNSNVMQDRREKYNLRKKIRSVSLLYIGSKKIYVFFADGGFPLVESRKNERSSERMHANVE